MIDGVKIVTKLHDASHLINNQLLDFKSLVNTDTGEISCNKYGTYTRISNYKNLKFTLKENSHGQYILIIEGSLHKYFNNGVHNYNDFTFENLYSILSDLERKFGLNLSNCTLHNLEFGLNISPPIASKKILKGLLSHRNCPFKNISMDHAEFYQVQHNHYFIKVYDKAKQYRRRFDLEKDILRYELKYVKMEYIIRLLKGKNLVHGDSLTLNDLRNLEVLNVLGDHLLKIWNEILIYDYTIERKKLGKHLKKKIVQWQNIHFWEDLPKQQKLKQKNKLYEVIKCYSQNVQCEFSRLLKGKLEFILAKRLPIDQESNFEKGYSLPKYKNLMRSPIASINIASIGNHKQKLKRLEKVEVSIPDYEDWIKGPMP